MFEEKMEELKTLIANTNQAIIGKREEVKAALAENDLEKAKTIKADLETDKETLASAEEELALYESARANGGSEQVATHEIPNDNKLDYRKAVNEFIRSGGKTIAQGIATAGKDEILIPFNEITPTTDGVKKTDTSKVTSEEISYNPAREIKTVTDLKPFTTIYPAKKASGKYPILKKATTKMVSVEELEKNPALAKPEFDEVDWKITTYRGAIPVSQESIDDADVDLMALVAENAGQIKMNTTNAAIADVLKSFPAKTVTNLDGLKEIINVLLDPAYEVSFVVSQSFYQILDTLKDGNGRYLLQDSIISASGKVFNGKTVFVLNDEVMGQAGEAKAFVGDFKRGVLFADRKDLGLRWVDNEIYGQYLQAVLRFGVKKLDEKAGYFVTFSATPSDSH